MLRVSDRPIVAYFYCIRSIHLQTFCTLSLTSTKQNCLSTHFNYLHIPSIPTDLPACLTAYATQMGDICSIKTQVST